MNVADDPAINEQDCLNTIDEGSHGLAIDHYAAGDTDYEFSIMGVSKPFVFALVCETTGPERRATSWEQMPPDWHSTPLPPSNRAWRPHQSDGECWP
jgi:hypothetical protein